jgi:shikimate 5-dehydrogenase
MSIWRDIRKELVAAAAALAVASAGLAVKTFVDRNDDRCEQVAKYWGDETPHPAISPPRQVQSTPPSSISPTRLPTAVVPTHPVNEIMADAAAKCFRNL